MMIKVKSHSLALSREKISNSLLHFVMQYGKYCSGEILIFCKKMMQSSSFLVKCSRSVVHRGTILRRKFSSPASSPSSADAYSLGLQILHWTMGVMMNYSYQLFQ